MLWCMSTVSIAVVLNTAAMQFNILSMMYSDVNFSILNNLVIDWYLTSLVQNWIVSAFWKSSIAGS